MRGRHTQIAMEFMFKYGEEQYNKMTEFMQNSGVDLTSVVADTMIKFRSFYLGTGE